MPFRSASTPSLHPVPGTKTGTPGEFFDGTPNTVRVSDPGRESWVFRRAAEPGRRKANVGDAIRKHIEVRKREVRAGEGRRNAGRKIIS